MNDSRVSFEGMLRRRSEVVLAPASGVPCLHWRLKITEPIDARLQLVHEMSSPEGFDVNWALGGLPTPTRLRLAVAAEAGEASMSAAPAGDSGHRDAVRIRVSADALQVQALPVLHRPGSPGALRVAQQFGMSPSISVEEVILSEGERVHLAGILEGGVLGGDRGPFREVATEVQLLECALVVPHRRELGPALLPWALGTAAAILGGVGVTAWVAWHGERFAHFAHAHRGLVGQWQPAPHIGPPPPLSQRHFSRPD